MRGTLAFIVNRFKAGLLERSFAETLVDQLAATDMVGLKRAEEETSSHPVTARFERRNAEGTIEIDTLRARYVVGCDGSRSMVRQSIGRALHGDSANQAWGVMDVLAVTDFPDVRFKSLIQSDGEGSILVIPREGGYLVRLYVELDKLNINEQVGARNITIEQLIAAHSASRPMGHPCIQVGSRR